MATEHQEPKWEKDFSPFKRLFREIRLQIDVGLKVHKMKRTQFDEQFYEVFNELSLIVDPIENYQIQLAEGAPNYDFIDVNNVRVKGNGFRSLLYVLKQLMDLLLGNLQKAARDRSSLFYAPGEHLSTLTASTRAFQGMELMLEGAIKLMNGTTPPNLHDDGDMAKDLLTLACTEDCRRDAFYGRCLGFQYSPSMKTILQMLAIGMASYEEWYHADKQDPVKQLLKTLWKGSKYWQHPTERGIKLADLTQDCSTYVTKAYWSITEQDSMKAVVKLVGASVDVSHTLEVPAKHVTVKNNKGETVTIDPPFSAIGYKPIPLTLVSNKWRDGQPCSWYGQKRPPEPKSTSLVVHVHGGGFVAQSPKSHEFYLRWLSRDLDCPVLSIDYSLAPEAPYPRALEEFIMAYAWTLNNLAMLGVEELDKGTRIIFAGDSAGGNLILAAAIKLKELGLHLPNGVFSFYGATIVRSCVAPSRFLSLMDPLLPIGVLISCLQAYTGTVPADETRAKRCEFRKKILKAKGYIVPAVKDPGPKEESPKAQPKTTKTGFLKRSQTLPANVDRPKPAVPPPPKATPSTTNNIKAKPQRPPPPKASLIKSTSSAGGSYSVISPEINFSLEPSKDQSEKEQPPSHDESQEKKEEDEPEPQEPKQPGDEEPEDKDTEEFTEVNLSEINESTKPCSTVPPSRPPPPKVTPMNDGAVLTSVAPFFPPHAGSIKTTRLGRISPAQEDILSHEEIEALTREILATYEDPVCTKEAYVSPGLAPDDMLRGLPPVNIIACSLDPLLDDSIAMAQRLKRIGQPVTLTVMEGLPHGFLSLLGSDVDVAYNKSRDMMREVLNPKRGSTSNMDGVREEECYN